MEGTADRSAARESSVPSITRMLEGGRSSPENLPVSSIGEQWIVLKIDQPGLTGHSTAGGSPRLSRGAVLPAPRLVR
jgi:hypothetical protein